MRYYRLDFSDVLQLRQLAKHLLRVYLDDLVYDLTRDDADALFNFVIDSSLSYGTPRKNAKSRIYSP